MLTPLKKISTGAFARFLNPVIDRVNALSRIRGGNGISIRTSPCGVTVYGASSGGATTTSDAAVLAKVIRSLQYATPSNGSVGYDSYIVRLDSSTYTTVETGESITEGDYRLYTIDNEERLYQALRNFTVNETNLPTGEESDPNWALQDEINPKILQAYNVTTDLRRFAPWFAEDTYVRLLQYTGPGDSSAQYYFDHTFQYLGTEEQASNFIDQTTGRLMSVYR
jgi:hypothetical protein